MYSYEDKGNITIFLDLESEITSLIVILVLCQS